MTRSITEWIARSDDEKIPDRVKVRVFLRYDGKCQCGCNRAIRPGETWQCDHKRALINGGMHREMNLQPLLTEHHKNKTKDDVAEKSRTYEKRKANLGIKKPRSITRWRKFNSMPVFASRER